MRLDWIAGAGRAALHDGAPPHGLGAEPVRAPSDERGPAPGPHPVRSSAAAYVRVATPIQSSTTFYANVFEESLISRKRRQIQNVGSPRLCNLGTPRVVFDLRRAVRAPGSQTTTYASRGKYYIHVLGRSGTPYSFQSPSHGPCNNKNVPWARPRIRRFRPDMAQLRPYLIVERVEPILGWLQPSSRRLRRILAVVDQHLGGFGQIGLVWRRPEGSSGGGWEAPRPAGVVALSRLGAAREQIGPACRPDILRTYWRIAECPRIGRLRPPCVDFAPSLAKLAAGTREFFAEKGPTSPE